MSHKRIRMKESNKMSCRSTSKTLLFGLLACLVIVNTALAGCAGPTATPATQEPAIEAPEAAVEAPEATEEPTAAPATEEPTAEAPETTEEPTDVPEPVSAFSESPMLADLVAAGDLEPVDERLPMMPEVVVPFKETGQHGGEMRFGFVGGSPAWGGLLYLAGWEGLTKWKADYSGIVPSMAESIDVSDDTTEYTFHLREGMKWSDGEPYTVDDIMFYIDDVVGNEELYPGGFSAEWVPLSMQEGFRAEKVDVYTFKLIFPESYGALLYQLATWSGRQFAMYSKHYLQQFHKAYNPDVDDLVAAEEGVEDWVSLFFKKGPDSWGNPDRFLNDNPELPSLGPFITTQPLGTGTTTMLERNPYYWKVDPAGNQLPYIDTIHATSYADDQARTLAMLNGDLDVLKDPGSDNRSLYFEARDAGDPIQIKKTLGGGANGFVLQFNMTTLDAVKAEAFSNKDFRIGVSHAVNREELIELFNRGQGYPSQVCPLPDSPLYIEQCNYQYIEYDLDLANEYLDKVLPDRDAGGYRLGPDGNRFSFVLIAVSDWSWAPDQVERGEIICGYMQAVGLDCQVNAMPADQFEEAHRANNIEAILATGEGGAGLNALLSPQNFDPMGRNHFGNGWSLGWLKDGGMMNITGEVDPPQWVLDAHAKADLAASQPTQEGQIEKMLLVIQEATDRFYQIGGYQGGEGYYPFHARLGNIPDEWHAGWIESSLKITRPEQWYLKE